VRPSLTLGVLLPLQTTETSASPSPHGILLGPVGQDRSSHATCRSGRLARGLPRPGLAALTLAGDLVDLGAVDLFRAELQLEAVRTTPARKPRTECCCQPVAFMIDAIVAPDGDCSIVMTFACFEPARLCVEPASAVLLLESPAVCAAGFEGKTGVADDATDRVSASLGFATLDIEILRSVPGG
jgi:hypothetical protein